MIAGAREFRLEAVGGVIKAGVDDAAVASAGVEAARSFLFDQRDRAPGETAFNARAMPTPTMPPPMTRKSEAWRILDNTSYLMRLRGTTD